MSREHILILYNEPTLPPDHRDADSEHAITDTVASVDRLLRSVDYRVSTLGITLNPDVLVEAVRRLQPGAVFNLFEGLPDWGDTEAYCIGLLEWLNVPYTGCPPQAACIARNKPITKQLLRGAGLPTPEFLLVESLPARSCPIPWPVIVKPSNQDASVGIDQRSVVTDQAAFERRVAYIMQEFGGPVLVEQFIPGREFNVGIVEAPNLRILPYSEIQFVGTESGAWPIITYDAKWKPGTQDYETTPPQVGPPLREDLKRRIDDIATRAFQLVGCRDYARVDIRLSPADEPYILEVNPNPDLSDQACMSGALAAGGLPWDQFVIRIVENALARGRRRTVADGAIGSRESQEFAGHLAD